MIYFPEEMIGSKADVQWYDLAGRDLASSEFTITSIDSQSINFAPGFYILRIQTRSGASVFRIVKM